VLVGRRPVLLSLRRFGAALVVCAFVGSIMFLPAAPGLPAAAAFYSSALALHPLETKAATAALLSVTSDALVQRREAGGYDVKRTAAFAIFNVAYKGFFLHFSLPILFAVCQGNVLKNVAGSLHLADSVLVALERTIANQLVVVPLVFFPLFFAVTGCVQGLSAAQSMQRLRENYLPMCWSSMKFWVPVQIAQFLWLPLKWQVSCVQAVSFVWNMVLSSLCGNCNEDSCALPRYDGDDDDDDDDDEIASSVSAPCSAFVVYS